MDKQDSTEGSQADQFSSTIYLTKKESLEESANNAIGFLGGYGIVLLLLSPVIIGLGFIASDVFDTWWIAKAAIGLTVLSFVFATVFITRYLRTG